MNDAERRQRSRSRGGHQHRADEPAYTTARRAFARRVVRRKMKDVAPYVGEPRMEQAIIKYLEGT